MKTKKLISAAIITLSIFGFSTLATELFAKKINFKYNSGKSKTKKMKLIKSFITNTSNAGKAKEIGSSFKPGQKINFYYKVGPVKVIKGKGAPFKTKLVIKKGSRTLKDFGWHKSNAVSGKNLKRNATFGWFHTAKWYLNLSKKIKSGNYTAIVTHKDQNSRSNVKIRYNFIIGRDKIKSGNKNLTKNDYNSLSGFTVGMTMKEAKNVFRLKVIKTGILDLSKKSEKDYLSIDVDLQNKSKSISMGCYNSYAGLPPNSPPELFIDAPSKSVAIIIETVKAGSHSKKTVKAKTKKMLADMAKKLGKYTKKVSGYWGGYIWKKGNYRVAMHYENFAGGAQFVIYRTEKKYIKDYFFINRYWQRLKKFMK